MGRQTTYSPQKARGADKRKQALELRKSGATFAQIGQALELSEARAHQLVKDELSRLRAVCAEEAENVRHLELERLDKMQLALSSKLKDGQPEAINSALRLMERRAKLLGLDAPKKVEVAATFKGYKLVSPDDWPDNSVNNKENI